MSKKAVLSALFAILVFSGCGYKMVITGTKAAFTMFPAVVENHSDDIEATSTFTDEVKLYLTTINALAPKNKAQYIGEFTLLSLNSMGSSQSSSTTTEFANLTMSIVVKDKKGETVFERKMNSSENYDNTSNQSETKSNRDQAIKDAIQKIMMDFRNAFEHQQK